MARLGEKPTSPFAVQKIEEFSAEMPQKGGVMV
jgi:hypothetical protein